MVLCLYNSYSIAYATSTGQSYRISVKEDKDPVLARFYELPSHMCSIMATPGGRLVLLYLVAIQALIDGLALHIIHPCAHPATHMTYCY